MCAFERNNTTTANISNPIIEMTQKPGTCMWKLKTSQREGSVWKISVMSSIDTDWADKLSGKNTTVASKRINSWAFNFLRWTSAKLLYFNLIWDDDYGDYDEVECQESLQKRIETYSICDGDEGYSLNEHSQIVHSQHSIFFSLLKLFSFISFLSESWREI